MHIVMLSDSETSGGAAIAASRLAEALVEAGNKVTRIVFTPDGDAHAWDTVPLNLHRREALLLRPISSVPLGLAASARIRLVCGALDRILRRLSPDVINVHNLHGAEWSHDLLDVCSRHAPVAWTLHDAWSFTGHCVYYYDCGRFAAGCDATCPWPGEASVMAPGRIAASWKKRRAILGRNPGIVAVTPSRWLAAEAAKGIWKGHRIEVIPNGLPLDVYKPVNRQMAREAIEVDGDGPVLIAAAENLNDRRKGGRILLEALQALSTPVTLLTFGSRLPAISGDHITVRQLGFVSPDRMKVLAYNAADALVHPAPVDNLPNVVMEAIACGTPVVGFPIGGVPDMVRPGITGWLAKDVSSGALARAADEALAERKSLRDSCRRVAEAEYGQALQASRYLELFRSLCRENA